VEESPRPAGEPSAPEHRRPDGAGEGQLPGHRQVPHVQRREPTKLFNLFNYGELIHFGKHSKDYDKMAEEPDMEAIEHNNFMIAMLGLVHLYFGFSEVIRSAIGLERAEAA
jgi:hypothetical protein